MEENESPEEKPTIICASQDEVTAAVSALGGATTATAVVTEAAEAVTVATVSDAATATTLFLDLYAGCDVCGGDHLTEECPELGLNTPVGEFKVMSKARLTLPSNLMLLEHIDSSLTVVAQHVIPAKTQFGPFEARRTTQDLDTDNIFILKILSKDGAVVSLDTSNENDCNWMCLVQCAQNEEEQNCIAYQLGTNIFYNSIRTIQEGEQLKVWYALHYAKKLGKPVKPCKDYRVMVSLLTEKDSNTDEITSEATVAILQHQATEVVSVSEESLERMQTDCDKLYRNHILSLIQSEEIKEYKCSKCENVFNSQVDLAKHLRAHLVPNSNPRGGKTRSRKSKFHCSVCNIGFVNRSNYQRHMKKHKGQILRCVECGYRSYRLDVMWNHLFSKHSKVKLQGSKGNLFEYEDQTSEDLANSLDKGSSDDHENDEEEEVAAAVGSNDGGESYSELTEVKTQSYNSNSSGNNNNNDDDDDNNNNNNNDSNIHEINNTEDAKETIVISSESVEESKVNEVADSSNKVAICQANFCNFGNSTESTNLILDKNLAELVEKSLDVGKNEDIGTQCKKPDITKIALLEAKISLEDSDLDYKDKESYQHVSEVTVSEAFERLDSMYVKTVSNTDYIPEGSGDNNSNNNSDEQNIAAGSSTVQVVHVENTHESISEMYKNMIGMSQSQEEKIADTIKCENYLVETVKEIDMSAHTEDDKSIIIPTIIEETVVCDKSVIDVNTESVVSKNSVVEESNDGEKFEVAVSVVEENSAEKCLQESVVNQEFVVKEAESTGEEVEERLLVDKAVQHSPVDESMLDDTTTVVTDEVDTKANENSLVMESQSFEIVQLDANVVSVLAKEERNDDDTSCVTAAEEMDTHCKESTSEEPVTIKLVEEDVSHDSETKSTSAIEDGDDGKLGKLDGSSETTENKVNKLVEFVDYVVADVAWLNKDEGEGESEENKATPEQVTAKSSESCQPTVASDVTDKSNGAAEASTTKEEPLKKTRGPGRPRKRTRQALHLGRKPKSSSDSDKSQSELSTPKKVKTSTSQSPVQAASPSQSLARVLPTRRLKGIRTTGNKAIDEEEPSKVAKPEKPLEKKVLQETVKVPGATRRRGRPPKALQTQATTPANSNTAVSLVSSKNTSNTTSVAIKAKTSQEQSPSKSKTSQKADLVNSDSEKTPVTDDESSKNLADDDTDDILGEDECEEGEVLESDFKDSDTANEDNQDDSSDSPESRRKCKILAKDNGIDILIDKTDDVILYACCVCGKRFTNIKYLKLHAPAHTDRFRCDLCCKRFTRKESLMKHRCDSNANSTVLQTGDNADDRLSFTQDDSELSTSQLEPGEKPATAPADHWKCDRCKRKFSQRHLLVSHACSSNKGEENENALHQCDICEQSFRTVKYLFRHLAMHTDIFKCEQCGRCFSRKDSMQKHILRCDPARAAAENIHSCHNCGRTFSTKLGLENHLLRCFSLHCFKCRRSFAVEEALKEHECTPLAEESSKENDNKLTCRVCKKTFSNLQHLNNHEATHTTTYECDICLKGFNRNEELNWHKRLCMSQAIIKREGFVACGQCEAKFTDAKEYRDHFQKHTHPFDCSRCGKRFVKRGSLQTHSCHKLLDGDEARCEICLKTFRSDKYLSRHQIIHGEPQFKCEVCNKMFYRKDYLNDHSCRLPDGTLVRVVRRHNQVYIHDNLICHLCGKSFVTVSNLNKHLKCHGEKTCECDICGKRFHYITYLKEHKASVHENKYQHQCAECGKIVKTKTSLVSHMRQFHSDAPPKYTCKTCGKEFRQKGNMKTHMFSHSQEKHFACSYCDKKFKYPDQLNRHRLEHTMTNKLMCEYCGKKFVKSYELRKHTQIFHSGLMYVCDCCNAKCGHRHTLIRHYRKKHPERLHKLKELNFLGNLRKQVDRSQKNSMKSESHLTVKSTDISNEEDNSENGNKEEETIITLGADTSIAVSTTDGVLPRMAAEALHSLSNAVFTGQGDSIRVPEIHPTVVEEDGHTVVILQFVNQTEEGEEETVICGQEVETAVAEATKVI
ncbi:PR domain zinc finger protein 15-like isoform X1 [Octopus vulgaris]|uniref:PR domain zinc finger protein 15-like isoform X1 n=1 Tax=Octopus vulgaris TaxID=6645 RepID=A0AA36FHR7_OCTVU|nr:PR domain zinc finger protein 15-like isoform X1 [Octopus vulgaris]